MPVCHYCGSAYEGCKCPSCGAAAPQQPTRTPPSAYQQPPAAPVPPVYQQPIYQQPPVYQQQPVYQVPIYQTSRKSRWAAFFLCLFLGVLGIHRFYVGKAGTGILYLLTGGLFGIGWIVDLIVIAAGTFRDGLGYPLMR